MPFEELRGVAAKNFSDTPPRLSSTHWAAAPRRHPILTVPLWGMRAKSQKIRVPVR
jgi:hypothetical protein